jgi:hypothetical protein
VKRESGNSVDVDRDAYGVLGFDFVVVVAAVVVVTVAVFVTLQPLYSQFLAFQPMLSVFRGMDQNLNHPLQIDLPEVLTTSLPVYYTNL